MCDTSLDSLIVCEDDPIWCAIFNVFDLGGYVAVSERKARNAIIEQEPLVIKCAECSLFRLEEHRIEQDFRFPYQRFRFWYHEIND